MTAGSGIQYDQEMNEKFTLLFELYAKSMKRKAYSILKDRGWGRRCCTDNF